jgi:magnesium chelatase family protein
MIPGLKDAEFVRYGVMHRNTYINSPRLMLDTLQLRADPGIMFAGQITGVEGYIESTASGLVAGIGMARLLRGKPPLVLPRETIIGSLIKYITTSTASDGFQPMNANFGLLPPLEGRVKDKKWRNRMLAERSLDEAVEYLKAPEKYERPEIIEHPPEAPGAELDLSDVRGQENAKRALEIAAAGMHNIILIGPPGSGKTMLARRLPTILPDLKEEQALEVTKIYSIAGKLEGESIIRVPPFRAPHHTISAASLVGGGTIPRPGEISLAHQGVLFLDEMPEFSRRVLEALRQPVENEVITVSRVNATFSFPAKFLLAASANPCPCGYYGDHTRECRCSPRDIQKYFGKISGPLMDRIDLQVEISRVPMQDLDRKKGGVTSAEVKERVIRARKIQYNRLKGKGLMYNSQLSIKDIEQKCNVSAKAMDFLNSTYRRLDLSARGYVKVLKVARTIADLEERGGVEVEDIAEALQYRITS